MSEFFVKSNKFKRLKFESERGAMPKDFKLYIKPKDGKPVTTTDRFGNNQALIESDAYLKIGNECIVMKVIELQRMVSMIEGIAGSYLRDRDGDLRSSRTDILNMVFDIDPNQEPF